MQSMKKKSTSECNSGDAAQNPKLKERHIVTWSQEEDDILREQIRNNGTENWAIIASKFKDKTTRQCRRRWFTYLNSDFKKGGWTPEEDMLLCEAQKIFGNRWTEIAKVVSGRTDNAVKNRFSTLCKKRAKHEALAKENNSSYVNLNNKRVIFQNTRHPDGILETGVPLKKMRRSHIADVSEDCNLGEGILQECGTTEQQLRAPFAVLAQNIQEMIDSQNQPHDNIKDVPKDASSNTSQGTFLKKDDPKIIALMQQAELLSSLALKVNTEHTDQSLENAWKVLQDFLNRTKESDLTGFKLSDIDFQLENFKDLLEDLSGDEDSQQSWRQPYLCEDSQDSSEYSTGSTILSQTTGEKAELTQTGPCESELQPDQLGEPCDLGADDNLVLSNETTNQADNIPSCHDLGSDNDAAVCALPSMDFSSPLQVTPLFGSLAAGIPSPQFSESERNFLLKTLGMESAPSNPSTRPSQPPPCKRALLHCL